MKFSSLVGMIFLNFFWANSSIASLNLQQQLEQVTEFKVKWKIHLGVEYQAKLDSLSENLIFEADSASIPDFMQMIIIEERTQLYSNGLGIGIEDLETYGFQNVLDQVSAYKDKIAATEKALGYLLSFEFKVGQVDKFDKLIEKLIQEKIDNPYSISLRVDRYGILKRTLAEFSFDYESIRKLEITESTTVNEIKDQIAMAIQVNDTLKSINSQVKAKHYKISFSIPSWDLNVVSDVTRKISDLVNQIQSQSRALDTPSKIQKVEISPSLDCQESYIRNEKELTLCANDTAENVISLIELNYEFLDTFYSGESIWASLKNKWLGNRPKISPKYKLKLSELTEVTEMYDDVLTIVSQYLDASNISFVDISYHSGPTEVRVLERDFEEQKALVIFNPSKFDIHSFQEQLSYARDKINSKR